MTAIVTLLWWNQLWHSTNLNSSHFKNNIKTTSDRELFAPVVNTEEVERAVELYHISREENIVAHCESISLIHVPGTQQRAGGETARDDNVLSCVEHAQWCVAPPFHLLHSQTHTHSSLQKDNSLTRAFISRSTNYISTAYKEAHNSVCLLSILFFHVLQDRNS